MATHSVTPARHRKSLARTAAVWSGAAALGVVLGIGAVLIAAPLVVDRYYVWYVGAVLSYWGRLAMLPLAALLGRTPIRRLIASGLLFGFTGFMRIGFGGGPSECDFFGCQAIAPVEWTLATTAAVVLSVLLVSFDGLGDRVNAAGRSRPGRHGARGISSGTELVKDLQRTLGLAVIVQSIDARGPVTIKALLMLEAVTEEVTAVGPTEPDAWRNLAEISAAWRNANDKQVPLWVGSRRLLVRTM